MRKHSSKSCAQRLALVMVKEKEACRRRSKIGEAAGALHGLVGISQMQIDLLEQLGRAHRGFIAHNADTCDGNRNEQAGVSQGIMIKEVVRAGAELVKLKH